ncbi:hypothetical protein [Leifsonia sp. NPDC058230]|uniref:hypothetical protein n=1 Tax=Leifsonia sp. NPDC058230 TaxID=3346391 RepID=UPI0036DAC873
MQFDPSKRAIDLPAPPTVDEAIARFGGSAFTLEPHESAEEAGASVWSSTRNGRETPSALTLSYTLWRHPENREDPRNLAELAPETAAALDELPPWPLPEWILETRARMRYPLVWDAVRTTLPGSESRSLTQTLNEHADYIVQNLFRDERTRGDFPGTLIDPVSEQHTIEGTVVVDGAALRALWIESDPHIVAVAAQVGDRMLSAVVAREHLPFLRLDFATRTAVV